MLQKAAAAPVTAGEPASAPDWPRPAVAWFAVAALMLAYTSSFIDRQILTLMVDPIRRRLAITDTQFSLLAGLAFSVFYTLMGLPLARLADRGSRRGIIAAGIVVWSLTTAACGFADSFATLFAARIGVGIGEATLSPSAYSMIADLFPPERRARPVAVYAMGPYLGTGLAMIVGGQVVDWLGRIGPMSAPGLAGLEPWQLAFLIVGLPGLLIAALFLLVREPPRRGLSPRAQPGVLRFLWTHRRTFAPMMLGFSIFGIAAISYMAWIPSVLIRGHGWTPGQVGLAFGSMLLGLAVPGVVIGGWLTDRLTSRGHTDAPLRFGALVMVPMAVLVLLTPFQGDVRLLLAGLALVSFGFGLVNGLPGTALQLVTPNQLRAQVTAAYFLVGNLISLGLGPTLVAWTSDRLLGGPAHIGAALGLVGGASVAIAAGLMAWSLIAFRASVAAARDWQGETA